MRKNSLFAILFLMLFISIDEGDGAGADGDIGDFEIDDDEIENPEPKVAIAVEKTDDPPDGYSQEEFDSLKSFQEEIEGERAVLSATVEITERYPDFDISKVKEFLEALPQDEQEKYNSPMGWENIHLNNFHKTTAEFDPFDSGRGAAKEPFDFDGAYKALENGDRSKVNDLVANSR